MVILQMEQRPYSTAIKLLYVLAGVLLIGAAFYPLYASPPFQPEIHARQALEAYRRVYPDLVGSILWKNDDWTIEIGGNLFYWARGRLLPEADRHRWNEYKAYLFYLYPKEPPDPKQYSQDRIAELKKLGSREYQQNGPDHHSAFRAALYGGETRGQIEQNLVTQRFLGRTITVHKLISEPLNRIQNKIAEAAKGNPEIRQFVSEIGSIGAYNWRDIRGTSRMSMHSYGLAIDILPRKLGTKVIYWQWEQERNQNWMLVSQERRWAPPEEIIRYFEEEGFIWGGKWDLYDQMHFEYRPELHEISKLYMVFSTLQSYGIGGD
ncbi:MAG: M15 family metallopeptidase [Termitinemataceae bacterium]